MILAFAGAVVALTFGCILLWAYEWWRNNWPVA